jgi:hypothetical protein
MDVGELNSKGAAVFFNTVALSGALSSNSTLSLTTASQIQWRSALNVSNLTDVYTYAAFISSGHPTANNDSADTAGIGYKFNSGSRWIEPTDYDEYICVVPTPTLAVWSKVRGYPVVLTADVSGAVAIDARLTGNKVWFYLDLNTVSISGVTLSNPINGYDGQQIQIKIRQDNVSAKTVSLNTNYRTNQIALDVSSTPSAITYLGFVCDISGGNTKWDLISQIYTA